MKIGSSIILYTAFPLLPKYEKILLNNFPVPFEGIFRLDNETLRNELLEFTRTGAVDANGLFLVPYSWYFHYQHYPCIFKWYLTTTGFYPISFPVDSYMDIVQLKSEDIVEVRNPLICCTKN